MAKPKNWRGDSEKVTRSKSPKAPMSGLLVNVAEGLDPKEREEIAEVCLEDFRTDADSRKEWDAMHADWIAVYNQRDKPSHQPWNGSADESLGILTEACNSFQARAYKAFFATRSPVTAIPVGKSSETLVARAKRVAAYLQWKLFMQEPNYKEDKSAMLLRVAVHGSDFSKTYFDPVMNRIVTRAVRAMDLYVNYHLGPVSIEDVPRKTEVIHLPLNEGRLRYYAHYFLAIPEPMTLGENKPEQQSQAEDDGGISSPGTESEDYAEIIEQHRDLDLDNDGIAEPYKVWVDVTARKLLRIEVRYEVDDLGRPTNGRLPIEEYTHYRFLSNPDGFYGFGLGFLIGGSNIAVNKLLRQFIDANTLAISGALSGFISEELNVSKGPVTLELGKFKSMPGSPEAVSKGIKTLDFKPPTDANLRAIQALETRAQRVGAATDALAGDIQKVMQPTTVMTMVEQGLTLFTSIQEFLLNSWSKELNKIYRLNSMYFRGEEWFSTLGLEGMQQEFVKEEDFRDDMMIIPVADPRMTSKQERVQKAQFLFDHATKNPLIATRPDLLLAVTRRLFEEMEIEGIDKILPKDASQLPPPQPDPKAQAAEGKMQMEQAKLKIDAQRGQMEDARQERRQQADMVAKAREQQFEEEMEMRRAAHEAKVTSFKAAQEARHNAMKVDEDIRAQRQKNRIDLAIGLEKAAGQAEIAKAKAKAAAKKTARPAAR